MSGFIGSPRHGSLGGATPPFYEYGIDYACRFNDDDSAALDIAVAPAMDDAKTFSLSFWVKRCDLTTGTTQVILDGGADVNNCTALWFDANNKLDWIHVDAGAVTDRVISTMVFRDTTNWYHIFVLYDSTDAVSDRQRVWVNGSEITSWATENTAALNATCDLGGNLLNIGCRVNNANYLDGYLAEMHFIDGTAYAVTDFGEFKNGVWVPIAPSVTYGSAGFYLDFADNSDFGSDQSGNANDFTDVNLNTNDQVLDTPTENYCTLNVLDKSLAGMTLSDGSLKGAAGAAQDGVRGTIAIPTSGKWYFEMDCSNSGWYGGICNQDFTLDGDTGDDADACTFLDNSTTAYIESVDKAAYWEANPAGNTVGVCVNMDDLEIHFTNNAEGEQTVFAFGATSGDTWFPYGGGNSDSADFNFGQQGFTLTPPARYLALNTTNIAATYKYISDIMNPSWGFNAVTYQGDDGATQAITGADHQPDLVWIKNRSQADSHWLFDSVRGATKYLLSNTDALEITDANDGLASFDTDGFTVMFNIFDNTNAAGENFIGWCWKEDPIYGFDIVTKNCSGGAEAIGHNLGVAPELIAGKNRDDVENWFIYHHYALNKTDPETDHGHLDAVDAWDDDITIWNDVAPTSTQFTVGTEMEPSDYIFYLWRSIEGFSKVFSYEANNNADGPFVYCGFRPKFVMIKNADVAVNWTIFDASRSTYNVVNLELWPSANNADVTTANIADICSNGFKIRKAGGRYNTAGTHIGIAMAELPGIYSNAR